jgi:hypothetical protein
MAVEEHRRALAQRLDDHGTDGEVGNEVPVHHVHMEPIGSGLLDRKAVVGETGEIGGKDGWCDEEWIHGNGQR